MNLEPARIDPTAFVAANVTIYGDVEVGPDCGVWFGAVVRGDTERVRIGPQSNVQDLCVLHADPGYPCVLGQRVTVGHAAIVHGAIVEDEVMIGMRAVLLNGVHVGTGSIIAAGTVVPEGTQIPPGSMVMGVPGKITRPTTDQDRERIRHAAEHYVASARKLRERAK